MGFSSKNYLYYPHMIRICVVIQSMCYERYNCMRIEGIGHGEELGYTELMPSDSSNVFPEFMLAMLLLIRPPN